MYLAYETRHYQIAADILGQEGVDLMMRCPLAMATDGRARVDFDETWAVVRHTETSLQDPLIVAHEFGHLWHVVTYPKLSLEAPTYRCEAVAQLFEGALVSVYPELCSSLVFRAHNRWDSQAAAVMDRIKFEGRLNVKDFGYDLLAGRYG
jgi:hypothetical protein